MRFPVILLSVFLAVFGSLFLALISFDPLELFHKPWGRAAAYTKEMQFQDAGLLRTQDYQGIIIGSSLLENTSAAEATRIFGYRFVNLSISGSGPADRVPPLQLTARLGKAKHVIYSLDWRTSGPGNYVPTRPLREWGYLYHRFRVLPLVYFQWKYLACLPLWRVAGCVAGFSDVPLEDLTKWQSIPEFSERFGGFQNWVRRKSDVQIQDIFRQVSGDIAAGPQPITDAAAAFEPVRASLEQEILAFAVANPNIRFSLVLPPAYRYFWAAMKYYHPTQFRLGLTRLRFLAAAAERLPNVDIIGFDPLAYCDDIANFKDLRHYAPDMNSMILHAIKDRAHEITSANVEDYIRAFVALVDTFPRADFERRVMQQLALSASADSWGWPGRVSFQ